MSEMYIELNLEVKKEKYNLESVMKICSQEQQVKVINFGYTFSTISFYLIAIILKYRNR